MAQILGVHLQNSKITSTSFNGNITFCAKKLDLSLKGKIGPRSFKQEICEKIGSRLFEFVGAKHQNCEKQTMVLNVVQKKVFKF